MLGIKKILRTVRKEFHGNEIFATNDPEMAILKWNHHRPRVGICAKPAQGQQQINPIAKFITQRKHCADGIIRIAMSYFGNEPGSAAFPCKFGHTMSRQQNHGIRVHAGTDHTMYGGCHRSDDSIGDTRTFQHVDCIKQQQGRFTCLTGSHDPGRRAPLRRTAPAW
jgi:hypothetical protein